MKNFILLLVAAFITSSGLFSQTPDYVKEFKAKMVNKKMTDNDYLTKSKGTYDGTFTVLEGYYYRIGVLNSDIFLVGDNITISKINTNTYMWENLGESFGWDGNVLYFQIDPVTFAITYPAEWDGVPQTLNGEPITTVELNPDDLSNVIPLAGVNMNKAIINEQEGKTSLNMVFGYYTDGSGPREFYFVLEMEHGVLSNPIESQAAKINELFNFTIPENTFTAQGGGTLTYTATLSDDNNLPAWLTFNAETQTFTGTPSETGMLEIKVTASTLNDSEYEFFTLLIYNPENITEINNPPTWDSSNDFGNAEDYSEVIDAAADNNGYLYTYGKSNAGCSFLGHSITEGVFLAKHDTEGNVAWLKQFSNCENGKIVKSVVVDTLTDKVYITGHFTEEFVIPDADNLIPGANGSAFIIQYATDGTFGYAIKEDIPWEYELDLAVDYAGNVILTSLFGGTVTISGNSLTSEGIIDVLIAKYNSVGVNQWAIRAGGETVEFSGICTTDRNNNVYLTGEFISENITVNQMSATFNEHDGNTILAKINPDGETQWIKSQTGTALSTSDNDSWPTGLVADKDGNLYLKGCLGDSTYFFTEDTPILLRSLLGDYAYYIAKFDADGNALWAKAIDQLKFGFGYNTMDLDKDGNVYFGLDFSDIIILDDSVIPKEYDGSNDLLVVKYNANGELGWGKIVQGSQNSEISSVNFVNNRVAVTGNFSGTLSFGDIFLNSENTHGFVAVFNEETSATDFLTDNLIKIFPNPTSGIINFELADTNIQLLKITDITGKNILVKSEIRHNEQIDLSCLDTGIYIISIQTDKEIFTTKIVKE